MELIAEKEVDSTIEKIVSDCNWRPGALITMLQRTQEEFGYLPKPALKHLAMSTGISLSSIMGTATFYSQFRLNPVGKYMIRVCHGTACHVGGANEMDAALRNEIGIEADQTTEDKLFSIEHVACLGCCGLSPVIMVNDEVHGRLQRKDIKKIIKEYRDREN